LHLLHVFLLTELCHICKR